MLFVQQQKGHPTRKSSDAIVPKSLRLANGLTWSMGQLYKKQRMRVSRV